MIFPMLAQFLAEYSFRRPFLDVPPLWNAWLWLVIPLVAGISIVYKSIKCRTMQEVPMQALTIFFWILLSMAGAAGALAGIVHFVSK